MTSLVAGVLVPVTLVAVIVYVTAPCVADDVTHDCVEPQLVLADHAQLVGAPVQLAVRTTLPPTVGVDVFAEIEHTGTGGGAQVTSSDAGVPVPVVFVPATV